MTTTEQSQQRVPNKTWELSLYELHRSPQDAITDNTEIAVSPRSLHSELMCPICLDMLKNTMATKECLHRFCKDCISTALRSGNKECPTCRKKLISTRYLCPDPNFDALISKIYPSRDEYEQHQERVFAKLHKNHNNASLVSSIEEGIKLQSQNRQKSRKGTVALPEETAIERVPNNVPSSVAVVPSTTTQVEVQGPNNTTTSNSNSSNNASTAEPKQKKARPSAPIISSENDSEASSGVDGSFGEELSSGEIELVFRPHPLEMNEDNDLIRELKDSSIRYIKTTANATVDHLSKYLAMRLTLAMRTGELEAELPSSLNNFCIYVAPNPDQYVVLSGSITLEQVKDKYWKLHRPMAMFYSWKKD